MPHKHNTREDAPDQFIADPDVARELGISLMSIWRYDQSPELIEMGWPAKVVMRKRNFRSRHQLEAFKAAMLKRAVAGRKKLSDSDAA